MEFIQNKNYETAIDISKKHIKDSSFIEWLITDESYTYFIYDDLFTRKVYKGSPLISFLNLLNDLDDLLPKTQIRKGMSREEMVYITKKSFLACLGKSILNSQSFLSSIEITNYKSRKYIQFESFRVKENINRGNQFIHVLQKAKLISTNLDRELLILKKNGLIEDYYDHKAKIIRLYYSLGENNELINDCLDLNITERFIMNCFNKRELINRHYIKEESGLSSSAISYNLSSLVNKNKIERIGKINSPNTYYKKK